MTTSNDKHNVHEDVERVENALTVVEQGNAAVLLDINQTSKPGLGAATVKCTKDGHTVLVPQPSDDPDDPFNWSARKKGLILLAVCMAAFQTDFQTAVGIPGLLLQGLDWSLSPVHINYANNLNILLNGIGSVVWMPFIYFWGRAPVIFWLTLISALLTLGVCFVSTFTGFYVLRALTGLCISGTFTVGLAFIQDMFFLHEQARKIDFWFASCYTCVYFAPMFAYYIVANIGSWRAPFWMAFGVQALAFALILLFVDETSYRRDLVIPAQPRRGHRLWRLVGIWQIRHRYYETSVVSSVLRIPRILFKPIIIPVYLFNFISCMWAIGINQSSSILLATPRREGGYGMTLNDLGYLYFSPLIGVTVGAAVGYWGNDWVARRYVRKHHGIFKPEARLAAIYPTLIFTVPGLITTGQAIQHHLSWAAIAIGWGIYNLSVMALVVPLTAYAVDAYPNAAGEISAWFNLSRTLGGFSVAYYQEAWGHKVGFDVSFGIQAAIAGSAGLIIIVLHVYGERLRAKGGPYVVEKSRN